MVNQIADMERFCVCSAKKCIKHQRKRSQWTIIKAAQIEVICCKSFHDAEIFQKEMVVDYQLVVVVSTEIKKHCMEIHCHRKPG